MILYSKGGGCQEMSAQSPIAAVHKAHQNNPIPAIENTIRLIEKDKVFLLFDYVGTPTVTRVLPILKRYGDRHVFLFFPFTGAQPQRQLPYDDFVFNLRASYHTACKREY